MNLANVPRTFFTAGPTSWPSPPPFPPTPYLNCSASVNPIPSNTTTRTNRKRVRHRPRRHRNAAPLQSCICSQLSARTAATTSFPTALNGAASGSMSKFAHPEPSHHFMHTGSSRTSYPMSHDARVAGFATTAVTTLAACCIPSLPHETAASRERRIFGGTEDDELDAREGQSGDPERETDLRGSMLDVVLRLFDGIDYDDDAMW